MEIVRLDWENGEIGPVQGLGLALGNFDGMHRGHRKLLLETALNSPSLSGILLFDPPSPFKGKGVLTSLEEKIRIADEIGLDASFILNTSPSFWDLEPEAFMERVLAPLSPKTLFCGSDFCFGKGGKGDVELLKTRFEVRVVPFLEEDGSKISASCIRKELLLGEVEKAASNLGRPYEIHGKVKPGLQNGRKIGFPTLNLSNENGYLLPCPGVYAGIAFVSGIPYKAMINVGTNPTVGELKTPQAEAYLLDYSGDAYGKTVYLRFLSFLRPEIRFGSLEELKTQLKQDEEATREKFEALSGV